MEKNKFVCKNCGYCCRNFGKSKTLPLFEFEIPKIEEKAKNLQKTVVFIPENILIDKKSGTLFCMNYGMAVMPCPFLEKSGDNKQTCSIYPDRPLICRKFPLEKNPLFHKLKKSNFFDCDYFDSDEILKSIKKGNRCSNNEQTKKQFTEIFGKEIWEASLTVDKIKDKLNKNLSRLEELKKIEIASGEWIDTKGKEIIGVFEFLKKIKDKHNIKIHKGDLS
ncbi:MAG: YkgJ family cysteine cluster protein [Minisyncoccales bacterium]